ncbi:MAG TPA: hypothetical protein VD993_08940 [Chitinophagaceae bacterium]|nr:hypothetical protein [Chitinophagaceae bacterium]
MKKIILCAILFSLHAGIKAESTVPSIYSRLSGPITNFDVCMDEYFLLSELNQDRYEHQVSDCMTILADPDNMLCWGEAIMQWNYIQEQIFEYLLICQNGIPAKIKLEGTK